MYSCIKCIVYDKLLKPRQSFWTTLYNWFQTFASIFPYKYHCSRISNHTSHLCLWIWNW